MGIEDCDQLQPGAVIVYLLRANQLPIHPEREWHGRVRERCPSHQLVVVDALDEGYDGYEEVNISQIIRIEGEAP